MLDPKPKELLASNKSRFVTSRKASLLNELVAKLARDDHSLVLITQDFVFGVGIDCNGEVRR